MVGADGGCKAVAWEGEYVPQMTADAGQCPLCSILQAHTCFFELVLPDYPDVLALAGGLQQSRVAPVQPLPPLPWQPLQCCCKPQRSSHACRV